jgi:hypothetical protein
MRLSNVVSSIPRWLCINNPIEDREVKRILRESRDSERLLAYLERLERGDKECEGALLYIDESGNRYYSSIGIAIDEMVQRGLGRWRKIIPSTKLITVEGALVRSGSQFEFVYRDGSDIDIEPLLEEYLGIDLFTREAIEFLSIASHIEASSFIRSMVKERALMNGLKIMKGREVYGGLSNT